MTAIEKLVGLTIEKIDGMEATSDDVEIVTTCGRRFRMYHQQDCCESVSIEDVAGDPADLIGSPITKAEEVSNADGPDRPQAESYTWTFYHFATAKGYVTVRWFGESNGYYGESAEFVEID